MLIHHTQAAFNEIKIVSSLRSTFIFCNLFARTIFIFLFGGSALGSRTATLTTPCAETAPIIVVVFALVLGTSTMVRLPFFDRPKLLLRLIWNAASSTNTQLVT
jgi:hypothetical protein